MRAKTLQDLLKKGDRIAVSNITGREAQKVSVISQGYCGNIVAGWALGKDGQKITVGGPNNIPVFGQFEDMMNNLPKSKKPNKIIVYSPPDAVYGDVKEVVRFGKGIVETIYVITEHVAIEVTAKLKTLCNEANIDIVGCNTLGIINAHDGVRIGAVGGDSPSESFIPGSVTIISNSGNMVNTISSYLQSNGLGISFGISTGKDALILTQLKDLLPLVEKDEKTKIVVLYIEPGGTYEKEAIEWMKKKKFSKPVITFIAGSFAEGIDVSLGHAGAVVEGKDTSASAKMAMFDDYFSIEPFDPAKPEKAEKAIAKAKKGVRVNTLHALVPAATALLRALNISRDFKPKRPLSLNPWIVGLGPKANNLPRNLILYQGIIPPPYDELVQKQIKSGLGRTVSKQNMRNASHASSNDGSIPRIYGYSLMNLMEEASFARATLLYWIGEKPTHNFEVELFEMCLIASLTNGPGTISAIGAKVSASAGNEANTAMMTTLGSMGLTHGGNGKKAAKLLIDRFSGTDMKNPYSKKDAPDLDAMVKDHVNNFRKLKAHAKDAGVDYEKIPCLGHPVFNKDAINYDPREREVTKYLENHKRYNVFLDYYHRLTKELMNQGATSKAHAVNVDAAISCVCMGIAWPFLVDKKITVERAIDLPLITFALGRVSGGAGEYLDHRESGSGMDMRVPVSECKSLTRSKD